MAVLYQNIKEGLFLRRPNRFIAYVEIDGKEEVCHVKNTGRCKELLIPGESKVYVEDHGTDTKRKTRYSLVQVVKGNTLINMDSQAPNKAGYQWAEQGNLYKKVTFLKAEKQYGDSRFDLYIEGDGKKAFVEIKGVTLEKDGVAMFPDAPTERGVKHIRELCRCVEEGYEAYILFVIQMKGITEFRPNIETHPEFRDALIEARGKGVHILAYDCNVDIGSMEIDKPVSVYLE